MQTNPGWSLLKQEHLLEEGNTWQLKTNLNPTPPAGMYGYHGKRILDFLRITMAMPRLIAPAKRLLEQGFKFGPFPLQNYQSYEANIDFEIRYVFMCAGSVSLNLW